MLENVPGITQLCFQDSAVGVASQTTLFGDAPDEIADFDTIIGRVDRDLRETGYEVIYFSIPAVALGAPHLRQRIFIVGHLADSDNNGNGQLGKGRNSNRVRSANIEEPESRVEHSEQPDQYAAFPANVANSEDMLCNGSNDNPGISQRLQAVSQPGDSSRQGFTANPINHGCPGGYPESGREEQGSEQRGMQQSPRENSNVANTPVKGLERLHKQCCPSQFWGDEGISSSGYADTSNVANSDPTRQPDRLEQRQGEQPSDREGINSSIGCNSVSGQTTNTKSRKSREQTEQERRKSVSGADNNAGNTQVTGTTAEREIPRERERYQASPNTQRDSGSDKWGIPNWDEHWYSVATRLCTQTPAGILPVDDGLPRKLVRFTCNKCSTDFNINDYESNTVTCPNCNNSEGIIENEIVEPDLPNRPKGWRINALKATGNAVVPQICLEIFRSILSAEVDYVADS